MLCPLLQDSVIYLKNWIVRKNSMGLFVDGVHKSVFVTHLIMVFN